MASAFILCIDIDEITLFYVPAGLGLIYNVVQSGNTPYDVLVAEHAYIWGSVNS